MPLVCEAAVEVIVLPPPSPVAAILTASITVAFGCTISRTASSSRSSSPSSSSGILFAISISTGFFVASVIGAISPSLAFAISIAVSNIPVFIAYGSISTSVISILFSLIILFGAVATTVNIAIIATCASRPVPRA